MDVNEKLKNEATEEKNGFFSMLLGTLGTSLLGNLLTGKGVKAKIPTFEAKIPGRWEIKAGKGGIVKSQGRLEQRHEVQGTIRAGQEF